MLFSNFIVGYNIVKLQTRSSLHSWEIATFMLSLLSKLFVTWKEFCLNMLFTYLLVSY